MIAVVIRTFLTPSRVGFIPDIEMRETIGKHDGGPSVSRTDGPPYLAKRSMTAYVCLSVESSGNDYGK